MLGHIFEPFVASTLAILLCIILFPRYYLRLLWNLALNDRAVSSAARNDYDVTYLFMQAQLVANCEGIPL